jgi:hypothetical protein
LPWEKSTASAGLQSVEDIKANQIGGALQAAEKLLSCNKGTASAGPQVAEKKDGL